jgi:HEAT repeat protein
MIHAPLVYLLFAQVAAPPAPVAVKVARPASRPAAAPVLNDDQLLKNVCIDVSGPGLLAFFRQRMTPSVDRDHLAKLTKQLSSKSEKDHAPAMAELVGLGPLAVTALRQAVNQADNEETLSRARKCLQAIEGVEGSTLVQSAVRALAVQNQVFKDETGTPQCAAETLLRYLPLADDENVVQEIESALLAIGMHDGKPEPALMRALTDSTPIRRGVAARVLCQIGGNAERTTVRPLLKDAKPSVRMLAALSLTQLHDAEAMTVLIDLIAELPPEGRRRVEEYLTELAGEWAVKTPQGGDAVSGRLRRQLWSAWWNTLDDNQLLDEFRNRTLTEEERGRALGLIEKFKDASPDVRTKAAEDLIGMGPRTASLLRQTLERRDSGPRNDQLMAWVRQCLAVIEDASSKPLPEAAPRLLALRRPRGTVETLLAYVPFAESETIAAQLIDVLAVAGCSGGKGDPVLVRALEDKVSARRAAAAAALCKGKADAELPAIRKLLGDADAVVRLRTAVALAYHGDKSAVPVLIALLADLPLDQVWEAEDVLTALAGDTAPNQRVGSDKKSRTASVDAWKAWWRKEEQNVDLAKLNDTEQVSSQLLVIDMQAGRVLEVSRNGKVRWQLQGPQWPWDAVVCRNGNVFVAQQNTNQVSMWSRQGKELWQKPCNMPFYCQQLRNGNLFVVGRQQISEFDINGKEVSTKQMGHLNRIVGGCQFPNGHIGLVTQQGQYVRLDTTGKQVKTYQLNLPGCVAMNAEVLPGDRVVASLNINRVAEYDDKGKSAWESNVANPAVPHRLPNGHTLVSQNGMNHLYELDRKGKIVAEKKDLEYRPWRIRRR